jgi:hypothetical protein
MATCHQLTIYFSYPVVIILTTMSFMSLPLKLVTIACLRSFRLSICAFGMNQILGVQKQEVTNEHPKPFFWTKTADEILANVARFCNLTSGTSH